MRGTFGVDVWEYLETENKDYRVLLGEAARTGNELAQIIMLRELIRQRSAQRPRDAWREIAYLEHVLSLYERSARDDLSIGTYYRTATELAFTYVALLRDYPRALTTFERAFKMSERGAPEQVGLLERRWMMRCRAELLDCLARGRWG